MGTPSRGSIALPTLALLSQMTAERLEALVIDGDMPNDNLAGDINLHFAGRYEYADALAIEVARQLHDAQGLPLSEALRIVSYCRSGQFDRPKSDSNIESDMWVAILGTRETWGASPRGSFPVTDFGQGEYWRTMHFAGTFDFVTAEIRAEVARDERLQPDSDPARIFFANVSAADRRLRRRAADLGIVVAGDDFVDRC